MKVIVLRTIVVQTHMHIIARHNRDHINGPVFHKNKQGNMQTNKKTNTCVSDVLEHIAWVLSRIVGITCCPQRQRLIKILLSYTNVPTVGDNCAD